MGDHPLSGQYELNIVRKEWETILYKMNETYGHMIFLHEQNKTLTVKHCPMEALLAEYFTKPLQGALFVKLWNYILGADYADGDHHSPRMEMHNIRNKNWTRK